jgi:hypothetical protein
VFEEFEQVLKVGAQVNKFWRKKDLFQCIEFSGRTDGRDPPRRSHEIPRIVGSREGTEKLSAQREKVLSSRTDKVIDPSWSRPLDPHVGSCLGTSWEKARELGQENREVARERDREFRHLRPRKLIRKLFNLASSEVARKRDRESRHFGASGIGGWNPEWLVSRAAKSR